MRFFLLIGFLFIYCFSYAQTPTFCIEKSRRNSYVAGTDTVLTLYKAISQTSDTKILLFTVKKTGAILPAPTIAGVNKNGDIRWTLAMALPPDCSINQFDAITLRDNSIFIFLVTQLPLQTSDKVFYMLWLTEDGNVIRQQSLRIHNGIDPGLSVEVLKLKETATGNILFILGGPRSGSGTVTVGSLDNDGTLQWSKMFTAAVNQYYVVADLITYDDIIIIQGFTSNGIHSTKLRLADGEIIGGKSHKIFIAGGPGLPSRGAVLTTDYKIKTLVSSRIFEHYEIYFSYTQDTALNVVQSTNYFTISSIISYLPNSVTLNNRGMALIKATAGTNPGNIGFFIADSKDVVIHEWTLQSTQSSLPLTGAGDEVSFDNNDSLYVYWNGKENGKNIVGWIKTGFSNVTGFCGSKDTSFIQTLPIRTDPSNWTFDQLEEDLFVPVPFAVSLFTPTITKELICEKITGFCNPIKISKLDTICTITDAVRITVNKNPECRGKILFYFDTAAARSWQQLDDTTLLLQFDKSWEGKIYVGSSFCPLVKDSMVLVVNAPLPGINLGKDTVLCKGDTLRLSAGNGFASYEWQDNAVVPFQTVTAEGIYYVTVKDNCRRSYTDSIKITLIDKKVTLGSDISICKKETIELTAKGNFASYEWSPSYNLSNINLRSAAANPEITTEYRVKAVTAEGCIAKDSITINVKNCPQTFFMPSAFTPNNDGKNDLIRPVVIAPLEEYAFSIYNRWGEQVFHTTDKSKGWDGKLNGAEQNTGSFAWTCVYKFYDQPAVFKKGTFILIR